LRFFLCDYSTLSYAERVATFLELVAVADGAVVIVARSGTACRALLKNLQLRKERCRVVRRALATFAAVLRWRRLKPTLFKLRQAADPDAFGGGFAEVDAGWAVSGDGEGHSFVVFALMDAEAGAGSEAEVH